MFVYYQHESNVGSLPLVSVVVVASDDMQADFATCNDFMTICALDAIFAMLKSIVDNEIIADIVTCGIAFRPVFKPFVTHLYKTSHMSQKT